LLTVHIEWVSSLGVNRHIGLKRELEEIVVCAKGWQFMLVLTSWDDGHSCDMRIGELLTKHGLAGTFFIPISNREGKEVMGDEQIRHLDQGFEIGGHTLTHQYLNGRINDETVRHEVFEGKNVLEGRIGHGITGFCYPGGKFNDCAVQTVMNAGFEYARTTENLRMDLGKDRWRIPTTLQFYPHKASVLGRNILRYPAVSKLPLIAQRFSQRDFVSYFIATAEQCAGVNGVFHLWGHSWEIDQHQLWSELDTLLQALAGMASQSTTLAVAAKSMCNPDSVGVHTLAERR